MSILTYKMSLYVYRLEELMKENSVTNISFIGHERLLSLLAPENHSLKQTICDKENMSFGKKLKKSMVHFEA